MYVCVWGGGGGGGGGEKGEVGGKRDIRVLLPKYGIVWMCVPNCTLF